MSEPAGLVDYHIHPGYSIDAEPISIEEYCRQAADLKLKEICFTTHLEVDPVRRNMDWFVRCGGRVRKMNDLCWLEEYLREIETAGRMYAPVLAVKAGIEVGYEPGQEKRIERVLDNYPFDFVLGSIHCLKHVAISSRKECARYFTGKDCSRVADDYFDMLEAAVQTGLFDCIAHVDLYRRYGTGFLGRDVDSIHRGRIEGIFRLMARRGMGLEINTSGLRRGIDDLHPSAEIMRAAVENGIRIFTTGSDAHSLTETGQGMDRAFALLRSFSLAATTYTRRKPDRIIGVDKPTPVQ